MSARARTLRTAATLLWDAYDKAEADIREWMERHGGPGDPLLYKDTNGRYILLDALTAIVAVEVARKKVGP